MKRTNETAETKWLDISHDLYIKKLLKIGDCNYILKLIEEKAFNALKSENIILKEQLTTLFQVLTLAKSIDTLDLIGFTIDKKGAKIIANYLPLTSLKHLRLDGNPIGDEGVIAIARALQGTTLENLSLSNTGIGIKGILAILKGPSTVTQLKLSLNNLGPKDCLEILKALPKTLTTLDLSSNKLGNEGVKAISKKLRGNSDLKVLNLSANEIGKEGAKAIVGMLSSFTKLEELNLSYNYLGSDNIILISRIIPSTSLTTIHFHNNRAFKLKVYSDGYFADDKDQRNLLFIAPMLSDTQVTTFGVRNCFIRENTIDNIDKVLERNKQKIT